MYFILSSLSCLFIKSDGFSGHTVVLYSDSVPHRLHNRYSQYPRRGQSTAVVPTLYQNCDRYQHGVHQLGLHGDGQLNPTIGKIPLEKNCLGNGIYWCLLKQITHRSRTIDGSFVLDARSGKSHRWWQRHRRTYRLQIPWRWHLFFSIRILMVYQWLNSIVCCSFQKTKYLTSTPTPATSQWRNLWMLQVRSFLWSWWGKYVL